MNIGDFIYTTIGRECFGIYGKIIKENTKSYLIKEYKQGIDHVEETSIYTIIYYTDIFSETDKIIRINKTSNIINFGNMLEPFSMVNIIKK